MIVVYYESMGAAQVDIRVDAQVIWLPPKTDAERIPATLARATLSYSGPSGSFYGTGDTTPKPKHAKVIVTGPRLRKLIAILNGAATLSDGIGGCTADFGEQATITMSFGGHKVVYSDEFACTASMSPPMASNSQARPHGPRRMSSMQLSASGARRSLSSSRKDHRSARWRSRFPCSTTRLRRSGWATRPSASAARSPGRPLSNPVKSPTKPPYFGKGTLVDRAFFWTIPGKMSDLVSWFRANPGPGNIAAEPYQEKNGVRRLDIEPKDRSKATHRQRLDQHGAEGQAGRVPDRRADCVLMSGGTRLAV